MYRRVARRTRTLITHRQKSTYEMITLKKRPQFSSSSRKGKMLENCRNKKHESVVTVLDVEKQRDV